MSEPFIGQITVWAGTYAPRGWAFCDGALLPIAEYTALFSVLGTTYGGDGRTVVGLPNLNGRVAMHPGHGPGLTSRYLGEMGGSSTASLVESQMASHSHNVSGSGDSTDEEGTANPTNAALGTVENTSQLYGAPPPTAAMNAAAVTSTGGADAHDNEQPNLAMSYIISLTGRYPQRS